jgi:hypothetical protein
MSRQQEACRKAHPEMLTYRYIKKENLNQWIERGALDLYPIQCTAKKHAEIN